MADRRYNDKEIAAIFRAAAEQEPQSPQREVARDEGLTLGELQAIGNEVGISADAVAQAARAVDVRLGTGSRTFLGLPIGVARTVNLNRRLTDDEWERLVVQLRDVFNARGRTRSDGSLRQWTNGNLQVLLEPTETGHRLRFGTVHGGARAAIGMGFAVLGVTATVAISSALGGTLAEAIPGIALLAAAGVGMIASGALRLPRWARLRERQMEALANIDDRDNPSLNLDHTLHNFGCLGQSDHLDSWKNSLDRSQAQRAAPIIQTEYDQWIGFIRSGGFHKDIPCKSPPRRNSMDSRVVASPPAKASLFCL